jgi:hypothetical protein
MSKASVILGVSKMDPTEDFEELFSQALHVESMEESVETVLSGYRKVADLYPTRPEPLYRASRYCRLQGRNEEGYQLAVKALEAAKQTDHPKGESGPYNLAILDELSINGYWSGHYVESARACFEILAAADCPDSVRSRVIQNGKASLTAMGNGSRHPSEDLPNALRTLKSWRDIARNSPNDSRKLFFDFCLRNHSGMTSQNFQDLFVLYVLEKGGNSIKNRYFVEFGAGDGEYLSNTLLLERQYGWNGILAEPARAHWRNLRRVRTSICDQRCVWTESGDMMTFVEANEPEISSIEQFIESDRNASHRRSGERYLVETVSLLDLLAQHNAPQTID